MNAPQNPSSNAPRRIFIKAVEGRRILKPGTRTLVSDQGEFVVYSPFWFRCLQDGDVAECVPPAPVSKPAAAPSAASKAPASPPAAAPAPSSQSPRSNP